ncbi:MULTISPECIES: GlxA family transcriptional regulator [Streptomyces]|uniref:AraC family transcriptional regulator n=1 Tax=Streptomyces albus (strain ATCC 21838 / DSM 41398 / FERM P-419 / JCM 4703 / NBRC 107858) TaxID=1081613 RepID=A0A0B5ET17_STRA4|nr:helix-turn-helix domain-containing protein [Streptomyces sp. SCSIO ZS0520]AJE85968.1 AraC family transcriptional regulator [Streptomyces albus]AOU80270.1 AraC family transcriptional regulator [Streptomyces albus]AYN35984.1 AraC family transcriptional regulator [Streptomyces albus]
MSGEIVRPHRVAVLALDGVTPFDLGIAERVFPAATDPLGRPLYEVATCSLGARPVSTSTGYDIRPTHGTERLAWADTLVIPTPTGSSALTDGTLPPALLRELTRAAPDTRLVTICTGSFVLAAAGLLDGRPATTHWAYTQRFGALFPRVELLPDVLYVDDGDILTSAGGAAGLDLCLHIVRKDHGSAVANRASRSCVVPPWREGGQAQFVEAPVPETSGATTGPTRQWILDHLGEPLALPDLAQHGRMSVRTFTRRFRDETGVSPAQWILQQRIARARQLLETTCLPIEQVATEAGFGSGTTLRQRLRAALGVTPGAYRRTFRHRPAEPRARQECRPAGS